MAENLAHATIHTIDLPPDFSSNKDSDSSLPKDDHRLIVRRVLGREFKGQLCEERIVQQHFGDTAKSISRELAGPPFSSLMAPTLMNTARATRRNAWPSAHTAGRSSGTIVTSCILES